MDEFDPVAFGESLRCPFVSMYGEAVVLHQNGLRRQVIVLDQLPDRFHFARINGLAIERDFHAPRYCMRRSEAALQISSSIESVTLRKELGPSLSRPVRVPVVEVRLRFLPGIGHH